MVCKKCGATLNEGVRFCTQCGAKVEADEPVAAAEETPVTTEAPVKAPEPAAAAEQPVEEAQAPEAEAAAPEAPAAEASAVEPAVEAAEIAEAVVAEDTDVTEAEATEPVADAVEIAEAVATGETEPETPVPPTYCAVCGAELTAGVQFCPSCGTPVPQPAPKKRKIWPWLVGAAALVALCVVLVVCLLPKKSPLEKLNDAAYKTFGSDNFGGSFTISSGTFSQVGFGYQFAKNDDGLTFVIDDGAGTTIALYNGYQLYHVEAYGSFKKEMDEDMALYLQTLNESIETMKETKGQGYDPKDIDIREILEQSDPSGEVMAMLEEGMDLDVLNDCLRSMAEKFRDEEWLNEYLTSEITEEDGITTYSLTIDTRLLRGLLELLEPAFLDPADYQEGMDALNDLDEEAFSLDVVFTTDGEYLTSMGIDIVVEDRPISLSLTFGDFNAAALDIEQLDAWLAEAEE